MELDILQDWVTELCHGIIWQNYFTKHVPAFYCIRADTLPHIYHGTYVTACILQHMHTLWQIYCVQQKQPHLDKCTAPEALDCSIRICLLHASPHRARGSSRQPWDPPGVCLENPPEALVVTPSRWYIHCPESSKTTLVVSLSSFSRFLKVMNSNLRSHVASSKLITAKKKQYIPQSGCVRCTQNATQETWSQNACWKHICIYIYT